MQQTKLELLFLAEAYEYEELFEQMADIMKLIAENYKLEGDKQRDLFSIAWKNKLSLKRTSWNQLISQKGCKKNNEYSFLIDAYLLKIENEIIEICNQVIKIINKQIHPNIKRNDYEDIVFFSKMRADYYKYMAELEKNNQSMIKYKLYALNEYQYAFEVACHNLSSINPIRLGVALNFSVFLYEIYDLREEYYMISKKAFDDAIEMIEQNDLNDEQYKHATIILQLLRDGMTINFGETDEEYNKKES